MKPLPSHCIRTFALALAALVSAGCATSQPPPDVSMPLSPDGLQRVTKKRGEGVLYARPDHHIGGYDAIRLGPVVLTYSDPARALDESDVGRLTRTLREGIARGVGESGLELAVEPGPCVLDVQLELLDLELFEPEDTGPSQTRFITSLGEVTLVFEMRDSTSGAPLVRFGERRGLGSAQITGTLQGRQVDRLGRALNTMFEHMGRQMQDLTPASRTPRLERLCQGLVGKSSSRVIPSG